MKDMRVTRSNTFTAHHANFVSRRTTMLLLSSILMWGFLISDATLAQQANWIWTGDHIQGNVPVGPTHFRKEFALEHPIIGELVIAADDEFQVYFNDQLVGYGNGYDQMTKIDLTPYLIDGDNLLAVRATNTQGNTGAMAAILRFRLEGETVWRWLATDDSWKCQDTVEPSWKHRNVSDDDWKSVKLYGAFGTTRRWDMARLQTEPAQPVAAAKSNDREEPLPSTTPGKEFSVPENFVVQQILDESVGSLIAMEFNEFGQLILSREDGKLLLADLDDSTSGKVTIQKYCDDVEFVQGILPLNGDVFVTGKGPQGLGLYRLHDGDRDGMVEPAEKLVGFKGEPGEHGPHGLTLGPDGMIYVMIGNASGMEGDVSVSLSSPITDTYEGEVVPRMEDPGGHAAGIKAPGGTIIRISPDGIHREIVASGLRNSYDLAFNRLGELFFHDSDMESDVGTPWYRPTQVFHATPGAEYGWRSGTAKFPPYFIDALPAVADTGRGSPTGSVFYDHVMMPMRYHQALFLGDWSEGRILCARLIPDGDTYRAEVEEFLSANPLTVTDLAVGPDGALYFTTGGRGTQGGVYRVSWNGQVPDEFRMLDDKLSTLVGRPQPQSAWTRQKLAKLKSDMGEDWSVSLNGILMEQRNGPDFRVRALEIMNLFGPLPSDETLAELTNDPDPVIRRKSIQAIGWRTTPELNEPLVKALGDPDANVRRAACESMRHRNQETEWKDFEKSLISESRTEAMAARRLLESIPAEHWRDDILNSDDIRVFLHGATALMIVEPTLQNAYQILAHSSSVIENDLMDDDYLDLLRVMQLALVQGGVDPARIPMYKDRILAEFPAEHGIINRELSRIIGYLGDMRVGDTIIDYLKNASDSDMDKLQVVLNLKTLSADFDSDQRLAVIEFLEGMQTVATATEGNYGLYLTNMLMAWSGDIDESQISTILQNGAKWPSAAMAAFYKLPEKLTEPQVGWITEMDSQLKGRTESVVQTARLGCIAVLGRSADDKSMYYLREVWRHEPERRDDVVLALAQRPDGPNWPYLISSLGDLRDDTASEVLDQLATVNKSPRESKFYREAILTGYRLRQPGAVAADKLLEHWTGNKIEGEDLHWKTMMKSWANWFNTSYPDDQPVSFEDEQKVGKYSVDQILGYIENDPGPARLHNGMLAFTKAGCVKCHRFNGQGESMGPDLSSIARRFSERETLRSVLHPAEIIPARYASQKILTTDGKQLVGLISETESGDYILLNSDGQKINIAKTDVEELKPATASSMPDGLFDQLTLEEIGDLMDYLYSETDRTANSDGNPTR